MPQDQYTVAQAAEHLDLSRRTILRYIAKGRLDASKIGDGLTSAYLIPSSEVERYESERKVA